MIGHHFSRAPWAFLQLFKLLPKGSTIGAGGYVPEYPNDAEPVQSLDAAEIATSLAADADPWAPDPWGPAHYPVLDLDYPAALLASSQPGHFHLYLGKRLRWEQYVRLLDVMADIGLIEPGYVSASKARGFTAVRLPWVRKEGT